MDKLRRMNFSSRFEKVFHRIAQMEADPKVTQKESDTLTDSVNDPATQRTLRQTQTCKPFPESFARDEKRLLPIVLRSLEYGGLLSNQDKDVSEQLEQMRIAFQLILTARIRHACTQCDAIAQVFSPHRAGYSRTGAAGPPNEL